LLQSIVEKTTTPTILIPFGFLFQKREKMDATSQSQRIDELNAECNKLRANLNDALDKIREQTKWLAETIEDRERFRHLLNKHVQSESQFDPYRATTAYADKQTIERLTRENLDLGKQLDESREYIGSLRTQNKTTMDEYAQRIVALGKQIKTLMDEMNWKDQEFDKSLYSNRTLRAEIEKLKKQLADKK
jgi:uncharacterized coiled-coil DUF342 family protein